MQLDNENQRKLLLDLLNTVKLEVSPNQLYDAYNGKTNDLINLIKAIKEAKIKNDKTGS